MLTLVTISIVQFSLLFDELIIYSTFIFFARCTFVANVYHISFEGAQWLSGRVLDSRSEGPRVRASTGSLRCGPLARHIYPSLVLVQPRKTCPCLTERLLMGRKESNQTKTFCLIAGIILVKQDKGYMSNLIICDVKIHTWFARDMSA